MTTITDVSNTLRPPAEYMREVRASAKERKRHLYVYHDGSKWLSTINLSMVPFDLQVWSVSPTGTVTTFTS